MNDAGRRERRIRRAHDGPALARRVAAGLVPGDHACASFGSDGERAALAGRYAGDALRHGERLLWLADDGGADRAVTVELLERAGIDARACMRLGQLELRAAPDAAELADPEALVARLQGARRAALGAGYRAVRVVADMGWAAGTPAASGDLRRYEREVARVFAAADIAALCLYDRRLFAAPTIDSLLAAHDIQLRVAPALTTATRRRLTVGEHGDGVMALTGALDIDASPYLAARLSELDGDGDVVVLTAGLGFADVSGCRALVRAAEALDDGCRLVLPDPSPALVRVLELCDWSSHERLVLD